jgi:glycosyltransferase involved in cell wall biosynthesis
VNSTRVAVVANAGLGGTEKAATIYAIELAARGYEVDYLTSAGPRTGFLNSHGVKVVDEASSDVDLYNYIKRSRPHLIHQHVPGYPTCNRLYKALGRLEPDQRPKVIETNVFGRLEDPESEQFVDFRLFISMASAAQAFRRARIQNIQRLLDRHTVVYYPVLPPKKFDSAARTEFRRHLGVAESEVLAVRVGRPGHKWATWECEAYAVAKKTVPELRLFVMEPPRNLVNKITSGRFGAGIIVRRETSDFAWLEQLYASADLMIHASDWGESFGYTIAEGMAAELPVITRSTPWCDNAQVELVKNRQTGFVCWSVPEMARRLMELASNETKRREMGTAAQQRILSLANPEKETDLLEAGIAFCLHNKVSPKLVERNAQLLKFTKQFARLERATSELRSQHPVDFAVASLYSCYRTLRAKLRAILNCWQRRSKGAGR